MKKSLPKKYEIFQRTAPVVLFHFSVEIKVLKDRFKDHKEENSCIKNSNFAINEKPSQVRDIHSPHRAILGKINYPIFQFPNIMTWF